MYNLKKKTYIWVGPKGAKSARGLEHTTTVLITLYPYTMRQIAAHMIPFLLYIYHYI